MGERFEWAHKFADILVETFNRVTADTDALKHARRSRAARKGWRTRKAMAKARKKS